LDGAIESVLNCSGDYLHEIIVIDDGSTDNSREIITSKYETNEKVKPIFKENGGQFSCFRKGIEIATGDVLCFLDPDDRYEPTYFTHLSNVYDSKPYVDLVYVGYKNEGARDELILKSEKDFEIGINAMRVGLSGALFGSLTSAISIKRFLAKKILALPAHYDWDWKISGDIVIQFGAIILGGYAYYLSKPLMRRIVHADNAVANRIQKDPIEEYKYQVYRLRVRYALIKAFRVELNNIRLIKREFNALPAKDFKLCWKYIEAVKKMRLPLWKRVQGAAQLLNAYFFKK